MVREPGAGMHCLRLRPVFIAIQHVVEAINNFNARDNISRRNNSLFLGRVFGIAGKILIVLKIAQQR